MLRIGRKIAVATCSLLLGVFAMAPTEPASASPPRPQNRVAPQLIDGGQDAPMFVAGYYDCEEDGGCFPAYAYFQPTPHITEVPASGGTRITSDIAVSWFADDPATNPADPVLDGWRECSVTSGGVKTFCLTAGNSMYGCIPDDPLLESIDQLSVCDHSGTNDNGYIFTGNWYVFLLSFVASGSGLSYCGGDENVQENLLSNGHYSPPTSNSYDVPYGSSGLAAC